MGLKENLEAAEAAVKYVKGLGIRANNKVWDRMAAEGGGVDFMKLGAGLKFGGRIFAPAAITAVVDSRQRAADAEADAEQGMALSVLFGGEAPTAEQAQLVKFRARWGVTLGSKAGNCEEQAIGALLYLFDNYGQVRPLHLMTFSARGTTTFGSAWASMASGTRKTSRETTTFACGGTAPCGATPGRETAWRSPSWTSSRARSET